MNIFTKIKQFQSDFKEKKKAKTQERLKKAKAELQAIKTENAVIFEEKKLGRELSNTKKELFEAKHPYLSAGFKKVQQNIKENKKKGKGIFAQSNNSNPFVSNDTYNPFTYQPQPPFMQKKKKR